MSLLILDSCSNCVIMIRVIWLERRVCFYGKFIVFYGIMYFYKGCFKVFLVDKF